MPFRAGAMEGDELLGKPAPAWGEMQWVNSKPLPLADLRGKVVLIRFWTDGCTLCEHTAPALNEFYEKYGSRGLVVLGFYHAKPPRPRAAADVKVFADKLGFQFPVALDSEWKYLNQLWLTRDRSFTSASFLLDRAGKIRFLHAGGEFFADTDPHSQSARDYAEIKKQLEILLAESGK